MVRHRIFLGGRILARQGIVSIRHRFGRNLVIIAWEHRSLRMAYRQSWSFFRLSHRKQAAPFPPAGVVRHCSPRHLAGSCQTEKQQFSFRRPTLTVAGDQIWTRSISDIRKRKQTCVRRPVIVNPSPPTLLELDFARKPQGLRAFFFGPVLACFDEHDTRFAYFRDGTEKLCRIRVLGRNSHTFPQSCPHLL